MTKERKHKIDRHRGVQPEYLSDNQVAAYLSVARDTVWRWSRQGRLPAPLKIGPNCTRWKKSAIDAHLSEGEKEVSG